MKIIVAILIIYLFQAVGFGQEKSPFNQLKIATDSTADYSFIVSGHFYGGSSNKSGYPANTLLANIDWLNSSKAKLLVCLGDLFMDVKNDRDKYESSFFDRLEIPLFNTVGNHDLTDDVYQNNYGKTSFYFEFNNDIHLFLDTERDNGDIGTDQIELIKEIEKKSKNNSINNVFIYGHRTIWKETYSELDGIFNDNTQSIQIPNYENDVLPILTSIGKKSNVYVFAGSIGGTAPASFFYHQDTENGITYIATAIRALPRDAMLEVMVNDGEVSFNTHSLTGQDLKPLEHYNVDYWQTESGVEPFNWRLVPYYFKSMLTHRHFWYGVLYTCVGIGLLIFIRRIRKKRKSVKLSH